MNNLFLFNTYKTDHLDILIFFKTCMERGQRANSWLNVLLCAII